MKSTKNRATNKAPAKGEPFTSASLAAEEIEQAAGEIGRAAHNVFFSQDLWPPFLRNAVELKIGEVARELNLPNYYETKDGATALQQLVDLFRAADDELFLPPFPKPEVPPRGDVAALAYHLSEALRIARYSKDVPPGLFHALGNANNDHITECLDMDSREVIELALRQGKERDESA